MYRHVMELGVWVFFTFCFFSVLFIHIQTSALLGYVTVSKKRLGQIKASDLVELRVLSREVEIKQTVCAEDALSGNAHASSCLQFPTPWGDTKQTPFMSRRFVLNL